MLVIEMTAGFPMLLPMIAACFAAMLVPNLLHGIPIYDSLRERVCRVQQSEAAPLLLKRQVHEQKISVDHQ